MHCPNCNQDKPHDPTQPPRTRLNGFYGWYCWDCRKEDSAKRARLRNGAPSPELSVLQTELLAAKTLCYEIQRKIQVVKAAQQAQYKTQVAQVRRAKSQSTIGRPYGELVREAQDALDQFEQAGGTNASQRDQLQWTLDKATHKANLFGPNACDVKRQA